jgi:microcystin-dependent protein
MSTPYIGEIRMFGFGTRGAPNGWQACDGSLLSIAEYEPLFALIGTTYGGDGQVTFAVPNLRGRVPVHQGAGPGLTNRVIGEVAGSETVTVTAPQMPAHTHALSVTSASATSITPGNTLLPATVSGDTFYVNTLTGNNPVAMSAQMTSQSVGSQPHDNTMPTLTVQFCIATQGIFPSPQ